MLVVRAFASISPFCSQLPTDLHLGLAPFRLLLRELASPTTLQEPAGQPLTSSGPTTLAQAPDDGAESDERQLGYVTYGRARVLMTRADFIMPLDHLNIISVDVRCALLPPATSNSYSVPQPVLCDGSDIAASRPSSLAIP